MITQIRLAVGEFEVLGAYRWNLSGEKRFRCKFIEPGLVSYREMKGCGIELLRKETIDKHLATAIGNPLTCGHVIVEDHNRHNVAHGAIEVAEYDATDGWYYAEGPAETEESVNRIRNNEKPSCGYIVTSFGPGGKYHGIKYDREITGIEFNHLAIVPKPRYELASFRLNAASPMNILKLIRKLVVRTNAADGKPVETSTEQTHELSAETLVPVDGKDYRMNELVEKWRAKKSQVFEAAGDDCVEIDGERVTMTALVDNVRTNAAPVEVVPPVVPAAVVPPVAPELRTNAAPEVVPPVVPAAVVPPVVPEVRINAAPETPPVTAQTATAQFFQLRNARLNGAPEPVSSNQSSGSMEDRVKIGRSRYGSDATQPGVN